MQDKQRLSLAATKAELSSCGADKDTTDSGGAKRQARHGENTEGPTAGETMLSGVVEAGSPGSEAIFDVVYFKGARHKSTSDIEVSPQRTSLERTTFPDRGTDPNPDIWRAKGEHICAFGAELECSCTTARSRVLAFMETWRMQFRLCSLVNAEALFGTPSLRGTPASIT